MTKKSMKRMLKKAFLYLFLLIAGSVIVESDIIMGHHEATRLQHAIHWIDDPKEEDSEDVQ